MSPVERRRVLPTGLTGLAGLACAACCAIPLLVAAGVLGGAGWATFAGPFQQFLGADQGAAGGKRQVRAPPARSRDRTGRGGGRRVVVGDAPPPRQRLFRR